MNESASASGGRRDDTPEPTTPRTAYADQAALADAELDAALASIRRRTDLGAISIRQAADERCAALQAHIDRTAELRAEHFGPDPQ